MSWPNKPVNGKRQSQRVVIYVIPSFSAGEVGEAGVETEEATDAGAAITGAHFFLPDVVCFPEPEVAFRVVFAVTSFAAASSSAGTFAGFFLAPIADLDGIEKES